MSDRKSRLTNKMILFIMSISAAVVLVIVFGYNSFSKSNPDRSTVTEYRKEGLPPETVERLSRQQASAEYEKEAFPSRKANGELSKAVLSVQGLSCSSCISEIKAALSQIDGTDEILVDISRSTAQVYFSPKEIENVDRIAEAITSRGYPAKVTKTYSPKEIEKERELAAARVQYYIASVGGWDIARADLDTELGIAKKRYAKIYGDGIFSTERGELLMDNLRVQIASKLIDEGIVMQEINKADFKVEADTVDNELLKVIDESGKGLEDFKASLNENGLGFDYFKKKFGTQILISRYVQERVYADASDENEKQRLLTSWFNNAKILAEVVYYDKELERLVQALSARGGCGG